MSAEINQSTARATIGRTGLPKLDIGRIRRIARLLQDRAAPALVLAGLAAWVLGLSRTTPSSMGIWGVLLGTGVWIPLGFALLFAGFVGELVRSAPRRAVMFGSLLALVVMLYATVPIIAGGAPEYPWVYKHINVIDGFQIYGQVTDSTSIYDEWPTLFTAVAAIASLAHLNAVYFAGWAPLFFELVDVLLVYAVMRTITDNMKVIWLALALFEAFVAWVGQDYLSPQAFAYMLWLAALWTVLHWMRTTPRYASATGGADDANGADGTGANGTAPFRRWLFRGLPPHVSPAASTRWAAIGLFALLYAALTTAHQLTPYIGLACVAGLTIFGLVRPRWLVLLMGVIAGGYLALHWHLVVSQFSSMFGGDPLANAGGVKALTTESAPLRWAGDCAYVMRYALFLGAAVSVAVHWKRPAKVLIPAIMTFATLVVVFASSYGGEAIFRIYLFASPWASLLLASAVFNFPARVAKPAAVLGLGITLLVGLEALFGPSYAYMISGSEVAASEWISGHVPSGSVVVLPVGTFPLQSDPGARPLNVQVMPADPTLAGQSWLRENNPAAVSAWLYNLPQRQVYVVTSDSMSRWSRFEGTPIGYASLAHSLENGYMHARLVYRNTDTRVYRLSISG
jgi:hypothetical protein